MTKADKPKPSILDQLAEPFKGDVVKWRAQGKAKPRGESGAHYARVVAYVDARIVIDRLNTVLGLNWQKKTTETAKGRVICSIGITLDDGREVWRDDGAGDTAIEGEKGAISDALKRAAVNFGVAAYLYELPSPWVEVDGYKKNDGSFVVTGLTRESKAKLAALAQKSHAQWAAHLKSIDAGDAEETEPPKTERRAPASQQQAAPEEERESVQTTPPAKPAPRAAAKREPVEEFPGDAPPPKAPKAKEPEPVNMPAPKTIATGAKVFPLPEIQTPEAIKTWSRQIGAAIRAAPDQTSAMGVVHANEDALRVGSGVVKMDMIAWATDRVHACFKDRNPNGGGPTRS